MTKSMTANRLSLFGPPGSGKDPQATRLAGRLGLVHISSGDLLRGEIEAGTPLGEQAKPCIEAGDLVPDEGVVGLVLDRLREPDARTRGFVLEGFPRTVPQAEALDAELTRQATPLEWVIQLEADEGPVLERTAGRGGVGTARTTGRRWYGTGWGCTGSGRARLQSTTAPPGG